MAAGLRIDGYDWRGGREAMLRFGPEDAPTAIIAMPLFEDANRTRATVVAMLHRLAARGIGGALPDLPGTGESLVATRDARLDDWRAALAAAAAALPGPVHVIAIRGGALIDTQVASASRWQLAPLSGAAQVRELRRVRALAADGDGLYAGNDLAPELLGAIEDARPVTTGRRRVVCLSGDPQDADTVLAFAPPWRRSEPARDAALAAAMADDIAGWIASCAG